MRSSRALREVEHAFPNVEEATAMDPGPLAVLMPVLSAAMSLVLGAAVLACGPRRWANRLLAASLALTAVHEAAFALALRSQASGLALPFLRVAVGTLAALPVAWLAFSLVFASRPASGRRRSILLGLGGAMLLAWAVLACGQGLVLLREPAGEAAWGFDGVGKAILGAILVGFSLVLLQLENVYRNGGQAVRWRSKFLVVGVFVGFAGQMVPLSHAVISGQLHRLYPILAALAFLVGHGLIAFSLVRHRLLEVDVFISRYVVYRSLTLALVCGYLVSLGAVTEIFRWMAIRLDTAAGITLASLGAGGLALVLLSDQVRRRIQRHLHTHFFNHKYDYRLEWMLFTRRLSEATAEPRIAAETVGRILEVMWVRQAAMYTVGDPPEELVLAHQVNYGSLPPTLRVAPALAAALLSRAGHTAACGPDAAGMPDLAGLVPAETRPGLVVPLVALNRLVGVLIVGPECSGKPFGVDDHDLLAAMAAQAGALVLNARLARESAEGRELQILARLSAFVAHDIKNAVAVLSLLAENARAHLHKPAFQEDALRTLGQVTGRMRALLAVLAAPNALPPARVQPLELASAVDGWVRELQRLVPDRIRLEAALGWAGVVAADPDQLRSVLQNLVLNAAEAIPAEGTIRIQTVLTGDEASLIVDDTGRGISPDFLRDRLFRPFQTTKPRGLGIGLYQCRHYVTAMGGALTVESEEGRGTRMTVRLPAAQAGPPDAAAPAVSTQPMTSMAEMAPATALGRLT